MTTIPGNSDILKPMKKHILLFAYYLLISLCTVTAFAAEAQPTVTSGKPQNGVFFTYTGYMTTVLELTDGHFRYWFESDVKLKDEPKYPLSGEYSTVGDTITLKHDQVFQKQWAFRAVNDVITLWRPDALESYKTDKTVAMPHLKKYGTGSILVLSDKPAEDLWKHRGLPSR